MSKTTSTDIEKDKLLRFKSIKKAIQTLEKQQKQVLKQGKLAPSGAWVARYQVRQNNKKYWYYKIQATEACFQCKNQSKLSKYKHLGKAGTPEHIDAVMSVFRRNLWDEIQNIIYSLDDCLLDISSGFEQEEEEPQD